MTKERCNTLWCVKYSSWRRKYHDEAIQCLEGKHKCSVIKIQGSFETCVFMVQHIIRHRTEFFLTFTFTILKCRNKGRSVKHFTCKEETHTSAMLQDRCSKNNANCTEPITILQTTKLLCYRCLMLSVLFYAYYKHKINTLIIFTAELRYFCVWIHELYYIQKFFFENPVLAIVPHVADSYSMPNL